MSVLGTNKVTDSITLFTETKNFQKQAYARLLAHSPPSHRYGSPEASTLEYTGLCTPNISICQDMDKGCYSAGILTCFPLRRLRLRDVLGSTNPWLTNIAKEPLPLRRNGFSPFFAATLTRILVRTRSIGPHGPTSAHARRPPTKLHCCILKYR